MCAFFRLPVFQRFQLSFVLLLFLLTMIGQACAEPPGTSSNVKPAATAKPATDVNLITAIDVSDSITRHEEWLQYQGLAEALLEPDFLHLVAAGYHRRVAVLVVAWSSDGALRPVVPWTVIASPEDARRVAAALRRAPRIDRTHYGDETDGLDPAVTVGPGGSTDVALAIDGSLGEALSAPFAARRSVINILSNGVDNSGAAPELARDRAVALGATVNAVVFGWRREVPAYFEERVIGGPGAFMMTVRAPGEMIESLSRKFWRDMIAARAAALPAG